MDITESLIARDQIKIVKRIKQLRKAKKITQLEIAQQISKNRTNYNMIENAKKDMSLTLFLKIINVLNISPSDFFKDLK